MSEWKEYKLKDAPLEIIDGDRGKNYPPQEEFTSYGDCLFLSTKNVRFTGFDFSDCQFISKQRDELLRKGKLKRNDLVLTTRGTIGNIGFYSGNIKYNCIRINSGMVIIRPNLGELLPSFNYYVFRHLQKDFLTFTTGSAQPQLPIRDLYQIDIKVPSLPEQIQIASILSSLDDKIDLLHRQNITLEQLAETLFRQWFAEAAEESWDVDTLGNIFDIGIGRTPPRKEHQWFSTNPDDVKWVSIKDMGISGVYIDTVSEYLTQKAVEQFSIPVIPENTVMLSFKMTIGRLAISTEKMLSNEAIAHFKQKKESILFPEFLYLYLKTYRWEQLGSTSSIVEAINSQMIKDMELVIPDEKKLKKFKELMKPYFEKIKTNQNQIRTLTQLRDTLLPKLMSGDVRVVN